MADNIEDCFIFTWHLDNISFWPFEDNESIDSPPFIVDALKKAKWQLIFYTSENYPVVEIYLKRLDKCEEPSPIKVKYEFSFFSEKKLLIKSEPLVETFENFGSLDSGTFLEREAFLVKGANNLLQDNLTICCKMWKCGGDMVESVEYVARARMGVERRSFDWDVHQFSTLGPKTKSTYNIRSVSDDKLIMSLHLFVAAKGIICLKLINYCENKCVVRLRSWNLHDSATSEQNAESFHDAIYRKLYFPLHFTKNDVLGTKCFKYRNDVLTLRCECAFSTGMAFNEIESIVYGCDTPSSNNVVSDPVKEKEAELSNIVIRNLKLVLREHDTRLKTKSICLPAHKCILGACSPVFRALFTTKKVDECVHVEDLDDDTVRCMLHYVYTGELKGLEWKSACKLYDAAVKYKILSLKEDCSSFLKAHLSPSNSCNALILADKNEDDDLKKTVQNFIVEHGKGIVNSDAWEKLMETHLKLAADTMVQKFK
ncbi:TD and POZ domain-containing protein 4 [Trichonephila clavipes]|nr:TD and POZ domain-containing protein 4 [Trichonephila clavipes]